MVKQKITQFVKAMKSLIATYKPLVKRALLNFEEAHNMAFATLYLGLLFGAAILLVLLV